MTAFGRIQYRLFRLGHLALQAAFLPVERRFEVTARALDVAPIFVVGPARSGTTLVYQAFVHAFNVTCLTNVMDRFPKIPLVAYRLASKLMPAQETDGFENEYGNTQGLKSPSQGYRIWYRWFPPGASSAGISKEERATLRRFVEVFQATGNGPLVSKWQGFNCEIPVLSAVFPNAVFVLVSRCSVDTALSVHEGWTKLSGRPDRPFTRVTRSYQSLAGGDIERRSAAYVKAAECDLFEDMSRYAFGRWIVLPYESFCKDPNSSIAAIAKFYNEREAKGKELVVNCSLPASFAARKRQKDTERWLRMQRLLKEMETQLGCTAGKSLRQL